MSLATRILTYAKVILLIFLIRILLVVLAVGGLVGFSFLITQGFTVAPLSERMVWMGIGIALICGFLVFGSTVGGRDFGVPGAFTRSAHIESIIDFNFTMRQEVETRFDFRIQGFIVGLCVFGLGALVQSIFG
jgi:hypothetical protein